MSKTRVDVFGGLLIVGLTLGGVTAIAAQEGPGRLVVPAQIPVSEGFRPDPAGDGTTEAFVVVRRVGGTAGRVSVDVETFDGTAVAGEDYESTSATLVFDDSDGSEQILSIPILDDRSFEQLQWLGVRLSRPTGGAVIERPVARVVIRDDDVGVGESVVLSESASSPTTASLGEDRSLTAFVSPNEVGVSRIIAILVALRAAGPARRATGGGGGIFNVGRLLRFGDPGPADQRNPVLAFTDDGGFTIAFLEQQPLFGGGARAGEAPAEGPTRVMLGSWRPGEGEVVPVSPLDVDLAGGLLRLVSGPGGALALFGFDSEGFAAGAVLASPGSAGGSGTGVGAGRDATASGSSRIGRRMLPASSFRLSPTPITDGTSNTFRGGVSVATGVRSWSSIPVALLLPAIESARVGGALGPESRLAFRRVSWSGEVREEALPAELADSAASPALSVSDRGRMALFARVAAGDITGDGLPEEIITGFVMADAVRIEGRLDPFASRASGDGPRLPRRVETSLVREIVLRGPDGEELAGSFSVVRVASNSSGDLLVGVQRAPESAEPSVSEVLGFLLDEDGTQLGPPFSLGEARQGEWDLSLGGRDRGVFSFASGDGSVRSLRIDASAGRGACRSDGTTLCLSDQRFGVTALWSAPSGAAGQGRAVPLTSDTGTFWFFDEENVEVLLKVLDACPINDRFWLFAGGLTDVAVRLVVEDTQTGIARTLDSAPGRTFAPVRDVEAFETCDPAALSALVDLQLERLRAGERRQTSPAERGRRVSAPASTCTDGALCLGGRFDVELEWEDAQGLNGSGRPVALTEDSGTFWFFDEENVEVLVKVLDACSINDRRWLFAAGLTDLGVRLTVRDTVTGEVREYESPAGSPFQPIADTDAFAGCAL